ncbi:hypothetical protein C2E31_11165 [Rhodopirellula baltica]|nr:hypothetical protein C2E31_20355 [Rhodopirellula baltica]PNY36803.1 hypothetical protein C2E31_11165 [Rhodopirellula baltica]
MGSRFRQQIPPDESGLPTFAPRQPNLYSQNAPEFTPRAISLNTCPRGAVLVNRAVQAAKSTRPVRQDDGGAVARQLAQVNRGIRLRPTDGNGTDD